MYALLNDNLVSNEKIAALNNRGFKYGDGCFETIRVVDGRVKHMELHFERLSNTLSALKLILSNFTIQSFQLELEKLIATNEISKGARIRYTVYRSGGGLYTPQENNANRLLEISTLDNNNYQLNDKGLNCGVCSEVVLSYHTYSQFKTLNALPYVMASIYKDQSPYDNLILLNKDKRAVELCNANLFLIKGSTVFTPPISEGCVKGVYREYVINKLPNLGYKVIQDPIHIDAVSSADEIFITNSISGIQWVSAFNKKRFLNSSIKKIVQGI
tara:strand:+ start:2189 stop:3004 length:816 start_codon:yes stop_codon:yes gene_type:complete